MSKYEYQVIEYARSNEKKGAWLKMKIKGDDGKFRDNYLKDESLIPLINKPGFYEFTKEKNGAYSDIIAVKFLRPLSVVATEPNGTHPSPYTKTPGILDPNVHFQNRSITAQVCTKAAAEIISKVIEMGAFKDESGWALDAVVDYAGIMAKRFMKESVDFISAPPAGPVPPENGTYTDDSGRTHEPAGQVEGA